jgi:hypothetical protein
MKTKRSTSLAALAMLALPFTLQAATITLEDVAMPNEQAYAGPGGGRYWAGLVPPANASIDSQFASGSARFLNSNTDFGGFESWNGFAYSNLTDTTTAGFGNQYGAWPGSGADGSANYAVSYALDFSPPRIEFTQPTAIASLRVANTTYAALSMRDGDTFAKKFGGASGDEPDFLLLTVTGRDASQQVTGSVQFYLADFRSPDASEDYILADWASLELLDLGVVSALEFSMRSSDIGPFGMNTPSYFAVDDIRPVPLPAAAWLLACGALALQRWRRVG